MCVREEGSREGRRATRAIQLNELQHGIYILHFTNVTFASKNERKR